LDENARFGDVLMSVKLLLADDYPIVREGFSQLAASAGFELLGVVESCDQLLNEIQQRRPDVLVTETRLAGQDVIKFLEDYSAEETGCRIVFFSANSNPTSLARAGTIDCQDYLLKSATAAELVAAIQNAAQGQPTPDESLLKKTKAKIRELSKGDRSDVPLTLRETQVLQHVAMGLSNREIGRSLEISVETVKEHVQNILRKLDANDRTQAAVWAVKGGLI
jgi:DNA-binding NarL/FixJ family response regulator